MLKTDDNVRDSLQNRIDSQTQLLDMAKFVLHGSGAAAFYLDSSDGVIVYAGKPESFSLFFPARTA